MTDKEVQEAVARADAEYDMLKDRVHEQYDEIQKLKEDVEYYKSSRDELITSNTKLREEKLRLNNIINNLEETLNKLIKEQLEQYEKRAENWEERRNVSNTWLTSRDCYYSILKYLQKLKGVDKE